LASLAIFKKKNLKSNVVLLTLGSKKLLFAAEFEADGFLHSFILMRASWIRSLDIWQGKAGYREFS
jgi:uncharacterized membrane protein